jgi:hypothetical protein
MHALEDRLTETLRAINGFTAIEARPKPNAAPTYNDILYGNKK